MRKLLFCILTTAALSLAAGKQPKKDPPPTVESVKAMSAVDLGATLSDTEGMMLENARHSVPDTLSALIRIHTKRVSFLETEAGMDAFEVIYRRTHSSNSGIYAARDARVAEIQQTIESMKALLEKLESKKKSK